MISDFLYLKNWLLENGELDMYDLADDLDKPIEIFDERGWRVIETLWYNEDEDQLKGWVSYGDNKKGWVSYGDNKTWDPIWEEDIALSDDDLSNIVKILKNGVK